MRRALAVGSVALTVLGAIALASGQASPQLFEQPLSRDHYVPRLGDIMGAMQLRHFKLWFAGKLGNWDLASFELAQMRASFDDVGVLYPGIPVADMTMMAEPVGWVGDAIKKKDVAAFTSAFEGMTDACNACHRSIGRGFLVIQVPTSSPFSNQSFAPGKP